MTARKTTLLLALGAAALASALPAAQAQDLMQSPHLRGQWASPLFALPIAQIGQAAPETAPTPPAAQAKSRRFQIGPEVGVFLPMAGKTRDQFGSAWLSLGLGLGSVNTVTTRGQVAFDLQVLYQKKGDNHAFLAPVGIGYRQAFSQSGPNVAYYGITGDLELADLRSGDYNVHSGLRTGFGGSALLGVNFGTSGYFEARYLEVSRIKSFDLSGLNLTAGYRF